MGFPKKNCLRNNQFFFHGLIQGRRQDFRKGGYISMSVLGGGCGSGIFLIRPRTNFFLARTITTRRMQSIEGRA